MTHPGKSTIDHHLRAAGFSHIRYSSYHKVPGKDFDHWLSNGYHGTMQWLEGHRDLRLDPALLMPGVKSIISLALPYHPHKKNNGISKYAGGKDYHRVIRKKLKKAVADIRREFPRFEARICVDSAPVLEKYWAVNSGLGWQGKNSNIIHPRMGSFFFIAELLINAPVAADAPLADHCGRCTRCIEACPTGAIVSAGVVDASRCLSYLTIESKAETQPRVFFTGQHEFIYGCDICQDVCPWNKFAITDIDDAFLPLPENNFRDLSLWLFVNAREFDQRFAGGAVRRAGYAGFRRNVMASLELNDVPLLAEIVAISKVYLEWLEVAKADIAVSVFLPKLIEFINANRVVIKQIVPGIDKSLAANGEWWLQSCPEDAAKRGEMPPNEEETFVRAFLSNRAKLSVVAAIFNLPPQTYLQRLEKQSHHSKLWHASMAAKAAVNGPLRCFLPEMKST